MTSFRSYVDDVVIATKVGKPVRTRACGPDRCPRLPAPAGRDELRHLNSERIDLLQLHRIDTTVPFEDEIGELKELQEEGRLDTSGPSR